jgi:hypothetical protein
LDEFIASVWEGLAVRGTVSCPLCAGPMVLDAGEPGDEDDPLAGLCTECGARLS